MPELPEVETVRRGIEPLVAGQRISSLVARVPKLRWAIDPDLPRLLAGQSIHAVDRRAKYLFFRLDVGTLVVHLGMTGILRVVDSTLPPGKHDHFDLVFDNGKCLRMNDSRRFGAVLYTREPIETHKLISSLGPEPLSSDFNPDYLYQTARTRTVPVKQLLMDQKVVVGVGNIYASEALFLAGIDPRRPAGRISRTRYALLVESVTSILQEAIERGGTTIRDFEGTDGKPGYFRQELKVYGREDQPCVNCHEPIRNFRLGGRSTYFCPKCQR